MSNSGPRQLNPLLVRSFLGVLSVLALLFVVYASLVPLKYVSMPWDEVVEKFKETPWFNLAIERRADWVANGLIMLPAGFLAAGAIDWRRRRRWPLVLASPFVLAMLFASVFGIEFVQIWFPPRVVSQNDIFAGILGGVGGVALWWIGGRYMIGEIEKFLMLPPGLERWLVLVTFATVGMCAYNFMPLDVLISLDEFQLKTNLNRINIVPFSDFEYSKKAILLVAVAAFRAVPYTFFATIVHGARQATLLGSLCVIVLEAVKIPIYSRSASTTDVVVGCIAVGVTAWCAKPVYKLALHFDRAFFWFLAAVGWSGVMLFGFLSRFDHFVRDPIIIAERLQGILVAPFTRAHASSEFEAGENILLKIVIFAALTFFLSGWCSRCLTLRSSAAYMAVVWCIVLGVGIELAQVFLEPLVPDVTDFIIYTFGALVGVLFFRLMIGFSIPNASQPIAKN